MNRKSMVYLSFVLIVGLLSLWGCPKKTEVTASSESQTQVGKTSTSPSSTTSSNEPKTVVTKLEVKPSGSDEHAGMMSDSLKPIYFDFDKSYVRNDATAVMKSNVEWLKANPKAKIKIEGNCDERGSAEYNQQLGQRRAASAKKYLTDRGISRHRISLVSYGKEKPICTENTEECWQKNRRDAFVVVNQ